MKIFDLLKGQQVRVMTEAKIPVELTIKEVKEINHSEELGLSTKENDWWPPTRDWTTIEVTFTNGYIKSYRSIDEIELVQQEKQ